MGGVKIYILVVGMVMNMGSDRKADRLSSFFCRLDIGQELINEHEVSLRELADEVLTRIK
jgi:hypothetical protein